MCTTEILYYILRKISKEKITDNLVQYFSRETCIVSYKSTSFLQQCYVLYSKVKQKI